MQQKLILCSRTKDGSHNKKATELTNREEVHIKARNKEAIVMKQHRAAFRFFNQCTNDLTTAQLFHLVRSFNHNHLLSSDCLTVCLSTMNRRIAIVPGRIQVNSKLVIDRTSLLPTIPIALMLCLLHRDRIDAVCCVSLLLQYCRFTAHTFKQLSCYVCSLCRSINPLSINLLLLVVLSL